MVNRSVRCGNRIRKIKIDNEMNNLTELQVSAPHNYLVGVIYKRDQKAIDNGADPYHMAIRSQFRKGEEISMGSHPSLKGAIEGFMANRFGFDPTSWEETKKTFILNCKDLGRKFTFNAVDQAEADKKVKGYEIYHSMFGQFSAIEATKEQIAERNDLHNEYMD